MEFMVAENLINKYLIVGKLYIVTSVTITELSQTVESVVPNVSRPAEQVGVSVKDVY